MQVACQPSGTSAELVAPAWHTRLLLAWLLAVPLLGLALAPEFTAVGSVWELYVPTVLVSVLLAAFVTRLGLGRSILPRLLGRTWSSTADLATDIVWAFGFVALVLSVDAALMTTLGLPESAASRGLLPASATQTAGWLMVALAVGVSEELVYRGYLQKQLGALSGSALTGAVLQALLFAIAHAEQGGGNVARFAVYALGFGWLARSRRSLLPGMLAHVAIDAYAGLAG